MEFEGDDDLQRAIREACFAEEPSLEGLPPRIAIYRRLVRNTLRDVVVKLLPRTREHLGDDFDRDFDRFLAEQGPKTHYLRDVPQELVSWAMPRWAERRDKPWLADLARHEIASFALSTLPWVEEARVEDVSLDKPLLLSSLARIERFDFAVHELAPHARAEGESSEPNVDVRPPGARAVALLYYRDSEHDLRTLELSPLAAALLLRKGMPLRDAVAAACAETGEPMNDETLASIARLLADLGERGVLLGARA